MKTEIEKAKPAVTAEIITEAKFSSLKHEHASGWGDDCISISIPSPVLEFVVLSGGEPYFGIRVTDSGEIILTGYQTAFEMYVPRNLSLTPTRPLGD